MKVKITHLGAKECVTGSCHLIQTHPDASEDNINILSFSMHGRYGTIDLANKDKKGIANKISDNFYELPISNLAIREKILPLGGGGYFRLIPFPH